MLNYRKEIDGLRAIAVIPVILFHAGFTFFNGGFIGVDVFFVISGYLITLILLTEKQNNSFTLIGFYERRARRILPALFFVVIVCIPFAWQWMVPKEFKVFSQSLVAVSVFSSNILFWLQTGYFATAVELKPLLHTWSLAVEEQLYLLFPLLILYSWHWGKRRMGWLLAGLAAVSLALAQWGSEAIPSETFYFLPMRIWEFLIGALAAFYMSREGPHAELPAYVKQGCSLLGILLIAYAIVMFDRTTPFPSLYALVPTVGTALVILFASETTWVGQWLGSRLLAGLGLLSYSAYLWHQPLYAFARLRNYEKLDTPMLLLLAAASFILAYFTWRYVEQPFRDKGLISRNRIFAGAAAITAALISVGLAGHFGEGFAQRFDKPVQQLLEAANDYNPRGKECDGSAHRDIDIEHDCVYGNSSKIEIAVVGDSHAATLTYELANTIAKQGLGLKQLTYSGCVPAGGVYRVDRKTKKYRCVEQNQQVFDYLSKNIGIKTVVLAARWTLYLEKKRFDNGEGGVEIGEDVFYEKIGVPYSKKDETGRIKRLGEAYVESVKEYLRIGKKVILIYPAPEAGWDIPNYLSKHHSEQDSGALNVGSTSHDLFKQRNKRTYAVLDSIGEHPNLVRIKPEEWLCNTILKQRCITQFNGAPLYIDENHLSNAGTRLFINTVAERITSMDKQ